MNSKDIAKKDLTERINCASSARTKNTDIVEVS